MLDLSHFNRAKTDAGFRKVLAASILEREFSVHLITAVLDLAQSWTCTLRNCLWWEESSEECRSKQLRNPDNIGPDSQCRPHRGLSSTTARVERFDHIYKNAGMTHRVEAVILLEFGGTEAATFWMRKPSNEAIQATLRRRGSLAVENYQLIEL